MTDALLKHAFHSTFPDGVDATKLQPSDWNAALLASAGTDGQALTRDSGSATGASWTTIGGGGTPGGVNTDVQFNDGGVFGGDSGLTYAKSRRFLQLQGPSLGLSGMSLGINGLYPDGSTRFENALAVLAEAEGAAPHPVVAMYANVSNNAAGGQTISEMDALYLDVPSSGSGTVTLNRALFIADQTGFATTSYAIYYDAPAGKTFSIAANGDISIAGALRLVPLLVSALPSSPLEGMLQAVLDSMTDTWGATITGGGGFHVLGYYNGTNWTVAGL